MRQSLIKDLLMNLPFYSIIIKYDYIFESQIDSRFEEYSTTTSTFLKDDRLVLGSNDGQIRILDLKNQVVEDFIAHEYKINFLKVLTDNRIVTSSFENIFKVWDINTGMLLQSSEVPIDTFLSIDISQDDRIIGLNEDFGREIYIWNPNTDKHGVIFSFDEEINLIYVFNNTIVFTSKGNIILLDINTSQILIEFKGYYTVSILQKYSDSQIISASIDGLIKIWNIYTGICENILYAVNVRKIYILLDKDIIITVSNDASVKIWKDKKLQFTINENLSRITCFERLPNNNLISGAVNGELRIWDLDTGTHHIFDRHKKEIGNIKLLNTNQLVTVSYSNDNSEVIVWK